MPQVAGKDTSIYIHSNNLSEMNFYKNTMKTGSTNIGFIDISKIAKKSNFKFFQYFISMSDTYKPSLIDILYLFYLTAIILGET